MPTAASYSIDKPYSADLAEGEVIGRFLGSIDRPNFVVTGKRFKCWFMTPGIVNYEDLPNGGTELYRKETIDEALESLKGCPLTMGHVPTSLTREELLEYENGKVDAVGFDPERGWYFCEGSVDTDNALRAIESGWGVSVGNRVRSTDFVPANGQTWLNNPYDREIKRFRFHHLALVQPGQKPRFEDAEIVRTNSTLGKPTMFKIIKNIFGADRSPAGQITREVPAETKVAVDGKEVPLSELIEMERNNHCHVVMADDYVEHDGCRYHVGSLINSFRARKNAEHQESDKESEKKVADDLSASDHPDSEKKAEKGTIDDLRDSEHSNSDKESEKESEKKAIDDLPASTHPDSEEEAEKEAEKAEREAEKAKKEAEEAEKEAKRDNATLAAKKRAARLYDRLNAVLKVSADAKAHLHKLRQQSADAAAAKMAEEERINSERKAGSESFALLAGAKQSGFSHAIKSPAQFQGTREAARARGRKLFGSN